MTDVAARYVHEQGCRIVIRALPSRAGFPATKFMPPRTDVTVLHRSRGLELLVEGEQRPLTIVRGLPGSGKTTLVCDWANRWVEDCPERRAAVWVSCDAADQDPAVLWSAVVAALSSWVPFERDDAMATPLLDGTPARAAEFVANALLSRPGHERGAELVLVVDAAERAGDAIGTLIPLLEQVPPGVSIVFTSSVELPFPMQRFRDRRLVSELQPADLDLSFDETKQLLCLLESQGADFGPRGVDAAGDATSELPSSFDDAALRSLHHATEGWLVPYVLTSAEGVEGLEELISVPSGVGDRRIPERLAAFFRDVVSRQPTSVQNFLLQIALLDECTSLDCRTIIDAHSGAELLRAADARGLFLRAGHETDSYRLHRLFRQFLRQERAGRDPQDDIELHRRAASWYALNGRHRRAVRHHVGAGDVVLALRTIGAQLWNTGLACGVEELRDWLNELDDDTVRSTRSAEALAVYGFARAAIGDVIDARRWLNLVDHERVGSNSDAGDVSKSPTSVDGSDSQGVRQMVVLGQLTLAWRDGDVATAAEHLQHLRELRTHAVRWPSVPELVVTTQTYTWLDDSKGASEVYDDRLSRVDEATVEDVLVASTYAYSCAIEGRLTMAKSLAEAALQRADRLKVAQYWPMDDARRALALVAYEQGRFVESRKILSSLLARSRAIPSHELLTRAALARIELAESCLEASLNTIRMPTGGPLSNGVSPLRDHLVSVDVRVALEVGDLARAHGLIAHVQSRWRANLLRARMALSAARLDDATEALQSLDGVDVPDTPRARIDGFVMRARLAHKLGENAEVERLMSEALHLALPDTLVRPFFEDGPELWPTLRRLLAVSPQAPFRDAAAEMANDSRRLSPTDQQPPDSDSPSAVISTLRPRELEVLRMIGQGLSNDEIATALFISLNTLKTHRRNLYKKLGISHRHEAIDIAEYLLAD